MSEVVSPTQNEPRVGMDGVSCWVWLYSPMTYGYRRKPYGNQARISADHGKTWSEPITISGDGANGDLGYPSTVELANGTLLTGWYEQLGTSPRAVLRLAKWTLN